MTYYYERPDGANPDSGTLDCFSDEEALQMMPKDCVVLYRENEYTDDGLPFVVLYEQQKEA